MLYFTDLWFCKDFWISWKVSRKKKALLLKLLHLDPSKCLLIIQSLLEILFFVFDELGRILDVQFTCCPLD